MVNDCDRRLTFLSHIERSIFSFFRLDGRVQQCFSVSLGYGKSDVVSSFFSLSVRLDEKLKPTNSFFFFVVSCMFWWEGVFDVEAKGRKRKVSTGSA
jgi:hypothetical protein